MDDTESLTMPPADALDDALADALADAFEWFWRRKRIGPTQKQLVARMTSRDRRLKSPHLTGIQELDLRVAQRLDHLMNENVIRGAVGDPHISTVQSSSLDFLMQALTAGTSDLRGDKPVCYFPEGNALTLLWLLQGEE